MIIANVYFASRPAGEACFGARIKSGGAKQVICGRRYAAEWIYVQSREEWGVKSVIKPAVYQADGQMSGWWDSGMTEKYLKRKGYRRCWAGERFLHWLKRAMGSMLTSCKPKRLLTEAAFRVLVCTLRR